MVYYDTLTLNSVATPVNTSYVNQSGWTLEEIDTAFQMDLAQPPCSIRCWIRSVLPHNKIDGDQSADSATGFRISEAGKRFRDEPSVK